MSAHPRIEELVVSSVDVPLSVQEELSLHDHLDGCLDCRTLAAAYRADASRLHAIAFQTPPESVRAAVVTPDTRPRVVRTRWLAIAAVIALLAALLGSVVGSSRPRPDLTITPLGRIEWLTPDDALRLVGAAAVDGGWLLATADESFTRTRIQTWRPDTGWTAEKAVDEFAPDPGALMGVGIQSPTLTAFVGCCADSRTALLYTRDRVGRWQRFEVAQAKAVRDVAVVGSDVWVLAAEDRPGESGLFVLPSDTGFAPIEVPADVRWHESARLAVTPERLAVAGCATIDPAACDLVIVTSRPDGQGWAKADLPRRVDLRTPVAAAIPALGDSRMLPPQVVPREGGFGSIVPTDDGGTQIWGSLDGLEWHVEATFASPPYPTFLTGDGTTGMATGGTADDVWVWIRSERGGWTRHQVELESARPAGVVLADDRLYAVGIGQTTVDGWQLDVPR